jgi:signal peptidase I
MSAAKWLLAAAIVTMCFALMFVGTFGVQMARVQGMAMAPTIVDQDRVIVNKLAYRHAGPRAGDIVGRVASRRWPMGTARKF